MKTTLLNKTSIVNTQIIDIEMIRSLEVGAETTI